ncbi:MAG: cation diffusion facilitator family transporter [Actinobacteria bacterium]|nr:cation diffusion facilitator family transporter [Actinomycetota bacterium]
MAAGGSTRAIVAALLANLGIAIAKFVGFLLTRASSMLAESIHSLADSGNQGLLLFGGRRAQQQPTAQHPFGYGRERYFWAFVVSVVLFALGSLFALFEGIEKLRHPHELASPQIAAGILAVGIVLEAFSFRTAIVEARHVKRNESWWSFVRHSRNPELPVVLLEDLGAMVGLVIALIAVGLAAITGDPVFDAYGTIIIGLLLGLISVILAVEMKSLLLGESARPAQVSAIAEAITDSADVRSLVHLQTQHLGPEELLVAGKVQFGRELTFHDVVDAINAAEQRVREAVPIARVIYLEPGNASDDANVTGLGATPDASGRRQERDVPASDADHHG